MALASRALCSWAWSNRARDLEHQLNVQSSQDQVEDGQADARLEALLVERPIQGLTREAAQRAALAAVETGPLQGESSVIGGSSRCVPRPPCSCRRPLRLSCHLFTLHAALRFYLTSHSIKYAQIEE